MTSFVRTAWLAFRRLPWMCCVALGSSLSRGLSDPVCNVAGRREPCGPEVPVWDSVSVGMWWFWKMPFGPAPCLPSAPGSFPSRELRGHTWTRARVHACFKAAGGPATGISLRSGFTRQGRGCRRRALRGQRRKAPVSSLSSAGLFHRALHHLGHCAVLHVLLPQ